MTTKCLKSFFCLLLFVVSYPPLHVQARYDDLSPSFPLPKINPNDPRLATLKDEISKQLDLISSASKYQGSSYSFEFTSSTTALFSLHHTAKRRNPIRPGADLVQSDTRFRIASITKAITVLALLQQHTKGSLHLDDPINRHIATLNESQSGTLPWKDITLRALASQLSGIPRDIVFNELATDEERREQFGLPPVNLKDEDRPHCDTLLNFTRPCNADDLLDWLKTQKPVFAPNAESTYSNLGYELLAIVLENVTGMSYSKYVDKYVLEEIGMKETSFEKPEDNVSAFPGEEGAEQYWDVEVGIQRATAGLYSTSHDLGLFIRYVLTHYNGLTPTLNWFQPASWGGSMQDFYGMPWEIYRTNTILPNPDNSRPVTIIAKGGNVPSYSSAIIMIPEYGVGVALLTTGEDQYFRDILETTVGAVVSYADEVAQQDLRERYVGSYTFSSQPSFMNEEDGQAKLQVVKTSSMVITHHPTRGGLVVSSFTSNGTDVRAAFARTEQSRNGLVMLVPTLLFIDEENQRGERWRIVVSWPDSDPNAEVETQILPTEDSSTINARRKTGRTFENNHMTDIANDMYAGRPLNEVIFWDDFEFEHEHPHDQSHDQDRHTTRLQTDSEHGDTSERECNREHKQEQDRDRSQQEVTNDGKAQVDREEKERGRKIRRVELTAWRVTLHRDE